MVALAGRFAKLMPTPLLVYLCGDLGAGKTTFTRAVVQSLGYQGYVKSPTYGLLETYELPELNLVHVDLYRIADAAELDFLGLDDLHQNNTVFMIEWPERGHSHLPSPDVTIHFNHRSTDRELEFVFHTESSKNSFKKLF
jgi:tRNA threonylcarbamoyladenosine biosynthesis protein TsaE